jgi:serine/threonine protein kinase
MIGRTLAHYRILEKLGEGGMGVVYQARDTHLDRLVALKLLPHAKTADPERKRRFALEAKSASALNHPHIVTVHDVASAEGVDFIVMECVSGRTLGEANGRKGLKLTDVLTYGRTRRDIPESRPRHGSSFVAPGARNPVSVRGPLARVDRSVRLTE